MTRSLMHISKSLVAPQTIASNSSGTISSLVGRQGILWFPFLPLPDLTTIMTAAKGGVSNNVCTRFLLKTGRARHTIRNCSNCPVKCSIYDIVTKYSPSVTSIDTPIEAWKKGIDDFTSPATDQHLTPGATPFKSPEFRSLFGVNKVTTVRLEAGQQHEHIVYHAYNKVVDSIRFENSTVYAQPGLSRFCMIVFQGAVVHEELTPATVSVSAAKLDYIKSDEYSYGFIEKTQPTMSTTNNLPLTITAPNQMGEAGDADNMVVGA